VTVPPSVTSSVQPDLLMRYLLETPVESVRVDDNKIFVAERTDRVVDVWRGLVKHHFMSVPILQKTGHKYYGFLDLGDIVGYVVEQFGQKTLSSSEDYWSLMEADQAFRQRTTADVMRYPLQRRNPFHPVTVGFSLHFAVELLAREPELHHLPVVDRDRNLRTLLTQSRVLRLINERRELIPREKLQLPVERMEGVMRPVVVVQENEMAMHAFEKMVRMHITGVGVVNDLGMLFGCLSLQDLKAISHDARMFHRLYQPLTSFLEKLQAEFTEHRPNRLIMVSPTATFGEVIQLLADNRVHRCFVVDKAQMPVGIITLRDVLLEAIRIRP
jgi:CBS domain-containing protein